MMVDADADAVTARQGNAIRLMIRQKSQLMPVGRKHFPIHTEYKSSPDIDSSTT